MGILPEPIMRLLRESCYGWWFALALEYPYNFFGTWSFSVEVVSSMGLLQPFVFIGYTKYLCGNSSGIVCIMSK